MTYEDSEIPEWFPEKLKMAAGLYKYIDGSEKLIEDEDSEYQYLINAYNHAAHEDTSSLSDEDFEFYLLMSQTFEDGEIDYRDFNNIDMNAAWNSYNRIKQDFSDVAEQMFGDRETKNIVEKDLPKKPYTPPSGLGSFGFN